MRNYALTGRSIDDVAAEAMARAVRPWPGRPRRRPLKWPHDWKPDEVRRLRTMARTARRLLGVPARRVKPAGGEAA